MKRASLITVVAILLLYYGLRLHRLDLMPVFIDEAFTIDRARDVWALHPFGGVGTGKPLIPWLVAAVYPFQNAVWAGRAITLLAGLPGLAALIGLGQRTSRPAAGLLAGLLYALMPFTIFYGRLAMSDLLASSLSLVLAWALTLPTKHPWWPLLSGGILAAAVLSRLPMAVLIAAPLITFTPNRQSVTRMAALYGLFALFTLPIVLIGLRGGDFGVGMAQESFISFDVGGLLSRATDNFSQMIGWLVSYVGWPLLIISCAGLLIRLWQEPRWPLLVIAIAALIAAPVLALGELVLPRYYLPLTGWLCLTTGWALIWLWWGAGSRSILRMGQPTAAAALCAALLPVPHWLVLTYTAPQHLPLPAVDQHDYVQASTSGYGLREAADWLAAQPEQAIIICSDRATCDRLNAYLYGLEHISLARTDVLSPAWLTEQQAHGITVLLAEDQPPLVQPYQADTEYRVALFQQFERPGNRTSFALYSIHTQ